MTDAELKAAINEVRQRARARAPQGDLGLAGVDAVDLMPLVNARDAAESKVAAIGTVNPRPPGLKNSIAQSFKRFIARILDWHVREQVEFNRSAMVCVEASIEALTAANRSIAALAAHHQQLVRNVVEKNNDQDRVMGEVNSRGMAEAEAVRTDLETLQSWRAGFEERYLNEQIRILRTVSELQAAYQHRLTLTEESVRASIQAQHADYEKSLEQSLLEFEKRVWDDMAKIRAEYERLIHTELRVLRQRQASAGSSAGAEQPQASPAASLPEKLHIDWMRFAEQFRGSEDRIRAGQARYIRRFESANVGGRILDIGCGRGEFLEAARAAGLQAYGIELNPDCVILCTEKGLDAQEADLFTHLESLADGSLGGLYCSQVVEHLTPAQLARLVELAGQKVRPGAVAAFETPNPACLAIFATHFYIDPTHTRPVPPVLLRFYLEESGFSNVEFEYLEPAADSVPAIKDLPASVQEAFFGGLDYALFAVKI